MHVECCGWTMLIKYLFKYISKGTDRITANIATTNRSSNQFTTSNAQSSSAATTTTTVVDEIKNFVDARYIGPHEACWRILKFDIHSRDLAVQILAVHLENMQRVTFRNRQALQTVVDNPQSRKTTLTQWLKFNDQFTFGRHLTYLHFPSEFVWSNRTENGRLGKILTNHR